MPTPGDHQARDIALHLFRPRRELVPLIVPLGALVTLAVFVASVSALLAGDTALAVLGFAITPVVLAAPLLLLRPVRLHLRLGDDAIHVGRRRIPLEALRGCEVEEAGTLHLVVHTADGTWRSPPLDEPLDRLRSAAGVIDARAPGRSSSPS